MDQLRANAFTARLTGQPLGSLLPRRPRAQLPARTPARRSAAGTGPADLDSGASGAGGGHRPGAGLARPMLPRLAAQRRWPAGPAGR